MFYPYYGFRFLATLLIVVGILGLLTNLGVLSVVIWKWWPILLVIFGIYIFVLRKKKKKIIASHLFHKITGDERIHEKVKKIIDIVDDVIDRKLDEWHEETTKDKTTRRKQKS